jgi:hypothetical protein
MGARCIHQVGTSSFDLNVADLREWIPGIDE